MSNCSEKSEIGNASKDLEFQEHNIDCLRTIVGLIQAPQFLVKCNSPWELCQHLERLLNGSGNVAVINDLAYIWRRSKFWPQTFTNDSYKSPKVWGFYLDLLPLNVILPEEIRVVLNRIYNESAYDPYAQLDPRWPKEQSCRRTFRLLHPPLKKEFMVRYSWVCHGDDEKCEHFTFDDLELMGWSHGCNPTWLISPFWFCAYRSQISKNLKRLELLCPGPYPAMIKSLAARNKRLSGEYCLSLVDCGKLWKTMTDEFGVWPLVNGNDSAIVFYLQEMKLSISLGVPGVIVPMLTENWVAEEKNEELRQCLIEK